MPKRKASREGGSPEKKIKQADEQVEDVEAELEEEVYKWWEQEDFDTSVKWTTLQHNGPMFPPAYEPHGVKLKYNGLEITLSPQSEEVAGFFAQMLETDYVNNEVFVQNFFNDFQNVLSKNDPDSVIKKFELCDFRPMKVHFDALRELKKAMTKEQKLVIKEQKAEIDKHYGWAVMDGRTEKVGNFRIEPPGLFRGRGDHPKTGSLKLRVVPQQITINIGKEAQVPEPPEGHQWGKVQHDNTVAWLATWTENISGSTKYVRFADSGVLKGISDMKKFEKARELKKHIVAIRAEYTAELRDKLMSTRQRATVIYLIDKLALRAGNEKGEDEADTVGCCSLRYEHIELEEDVDESILDDEGNPVVHKMVVFDFLGKDSVRYYNRVEVDPVIWKNLKIFKRPPKHEGDPIFDRLSTTLVNQHLGKLMLGLTAKVFRTYNASHTFQEQLQNTPADGSIADKILAFNRANREVAILCNHQRAVSKGHSDQMNKLTEKILMMKYQRHQMRQAMLAADQSLKKSRPELLEEESDLDEETIERKAVEFVQQEQEKLNKRHVKLVAKLQAEDPDAELPELPVYEPKDYSLERLDKQLEAITLRILNAKSQLTDKDENKTTALGTSKINYIDPRITASWAKKHDVPIEKMFTKTLREKFQWAMDMKADWQF